MAHVGHRVTGRGSVRDRRRVPGKRARSGDEARRVCGHPPTVRAFPASVCCIRGRFGVPPRRVFSSSGSKSTFPCRFLRR